MMMYVYVVASCRSRPAKMDCSSSEAVACWVNTSPSLSLPALLTVLTREQLLLEHSVFHLRQW